jgi:hypothetical protein
MFHRGWHPGLRILHSPARGNIGLHSLIKNRQEINELVNLLIDVFELRRFVDFDGAIHWSFIRDFQDRFRPSPRAIAELCAPRDSSPSGRRQWRSSECRAVVMPCVRFWIAMLIM